MSPPPRRSPREVACPKGTVVIGIDFGTTFSGVAFTWSDKVDQIGVVTSWEADCDNLDESKAPSAVSYGPAGEYTWGYSIEPEAEQLRWFKLLLLDEADLPAEIISSGKIKQAREYLEAHNKTATEVVTSFLHHLWEHSLKRIIRSLGRSTVNYAQFHVVITLPAIWPSYARERMRLAAEHAGILDKRMGVETQLTFVSEPEAAAIATLADMEGRFDVKDGDTFVVADCGGGTADLISYQVTQAQPMVVKECVKGSGGLCGAIFVDEAFKEVLKRKFDKKWARMNESSRRDMLSNQWETGIKRKFTQSSNKAYSFRMPFECLLAKERRASGGSLPTVEITPEDVKEAFDPVVEKIIDLIDGQIKAVKEKEGISPKYVILVGGFGRCKYLFDRVDERFNEDVEVLQSGETKPWTAICRGAVIHAATLSGLVDLPSQVQTRVARASYGICVNESWNSHIHHPDDKDWCNIEQKYVARYQMAWLLKEGDDISTEEPTEISLRQFFERNWHRQRPCDQQIYQTTTFPPPTRWNSDTITELCSIKWETEIAPFALPKFENSIGEVYGELLYRCEMTCSGESVGFAIYRDGKKEGSKSVNVDYNAH